MNKFPFSAFLIGTSVLAFSLPAIAMDEDAHESNKTLCLMDLPTEVHTIIASKCSSQNLPKLARVATHWNTITQDNSIWRNIALEKGIPVPEGTLEPGVIKDHVRKVVTSPIIFHPEWADAPEWLSPLWLARGLTLDLSKTNDLDPNLRLIAVKNETSSPLNMRLVISLYYKHPKIEREEYNKTMPEKMNDPHTNPFGRVYLKLPTQKVGINEVFSIYENQIAGDTSFDDGKLVFTADGVWGRGVNEIMPDPKVSPMPSYNVGPCPYDDTIMQITED